MTKSFILIAFFCLTAVGCKPGGPPSPVTNSNTNWLQTCDEDAECGEEDACICNVCTTFCSSSEDCSANNEGAICVATQEGGAGQICSVELPEESICLPGCASDEECGEGFTCEDDGACIPAPEQEVTPTCENCHQQRFAECLQFGEESECRNEALSVCHQICTSQECVETTQTKCLEIGGEAEECGLQAEQLCLGGEQGACVSRTYALCVEQNGDPGECQESALEACAENDCFEQAYLSCTALGYSDEECQQSARLQCEPNQNPENGAEEDCVQRFSAECTVLAVDPARCSDYIRQVCGEEGEPFEIEQCVEELFSDCAANGQGEETCLEEGENFCLSLANR